MNQSPSSDIKKNENLIHTKINPSDQINNEDYLEGINIGGKKLKRKIIRGVLLLSILPVLFLGATSYFKNQSIESKISPTKEGELAYVILYQQSLWLVLATGTIAGVTGTLAFMLADRFMEPILKSAAISARMVDRLYTKESLPDHSIKKDELKSLVSNLNLLEQRLPDLLWKHETKQENFQTVMEINYFLQKSRSVEEMFRKTVEETRRILRADRVTILQINSNNTGTFIEESVAPRLPKIVGTTVDELNFELEYVGDYQKDYVRAINNIYQADLSDRYLALLERFAVKANLIAPIKCSEGKELLGLLIVHQCNSFRNWQSQEIELLTHIAQQVGFSFEHTQLLEQSESKAEQAQQFIDLAHLIRESLNEDEILDTTVRELRKEIRADRVVVYSFNYDWSGYISAESVLPGWPRALDRKITDPCIPQNLLQAYLQDRVVANNNVFEANFHPDHLQLMEQLEIKANLIVPIVNSGQLFGLLVAHQCSAPRQWQQSEINLFSQVATQVGFALEHARLLTRVKGEGDKTRLLENITRRVSTSLEVEDIFASGVEEVREFLNCDRVIVYSFDPKWNGTVVAESVVSGFVPMLEAQINDPCFVEGFIEKYQEGRIQIVDNVHEAQLSDCYIEQLTNFEVKANLAVPILQDEQLLGLLIAHQCSTPRYWQDWEVDFFTQVAKQMSFALSRARLVQKLEAESRQNKLILDISRRIRASLVEENVLKTAVKEVRKAIDCDRVMIYNFNSDWHGTVVAESLVPGLAKALWREIKDPCFTNGYVEKYQAGRIQVVDNIYEAGLTQCHIDQLEPFEIKANLVVPILRDEQLMGLLIANHCSAPYHWQKWEINLMSNIANQVSFALEHCRILAQSEQSYQQVETNARQQQQQKENVLNQIIELLTRSEYVAANVSEQNLTHKQSMTALYEQIKTITDAVVGLTSIAKQAEIEEQKWVGSFADSQEIWLQTINSGKNLQTNTIEVASKVNHLASLSPNILQILNNIGEYIAQLKLEGMNGVLEAARSPVTSQKFAALSQKIHGLAQQLDQEILQIQPLVSVVKTNVEEIESTLKGEKAQVKKLQVLQEQTQQKFEQINSANKQIKTLVTEFSQAAKQQIKALEEVGESLSTIADFNGENIEQSHNIMASFTRLKANVEKLKVSNSKIDNEQ